MAGDSCESVDRIWSELRGGDIDKEDLTQMLGGLRQRRRTTTGGRRVPAAAHLGGLWQQLSSRPFDIDAFVPAQKQDDGRPGADGEERSLARRGTTKAGHVTRHATDDREESETAHGGEQISEAASYTPDLGDSDDDEQDESVARASSPPAKAPSWRVERIARAMRSDDPRDRTGALVELRTAISTAVENLPDAAAPRLDYQPPYGMGDQFLDAPDRSEDGARVQPARSCDDAAQHQEQLQAILNSCGMQLFRLIGSGGSERCRQLSIECLNSLLLAGRHADVSKHLPYLVSALAARFPRSGGYDEALQVFVQDSRAHDRYKRGGAVERQDREGLLAGGRLSSHAALEPNEDLRLGTVSALDCLLRGLEAAGTTRLLDPYYSDLVLALQAGLGDPCPRARIASGRLLVQLVRCPHFGEGARFFATGLARAAIPSCRHRNTGVVVSAVELFEAAACVPDRAKRRGAGTAAIVDLVGFREENVLPVAAFYDSQCGVSVNVLAELASHRNHRARSRCCGMLSRLLVYLPDSYDHQTRLLPYVLSFLCDDVPSIRAAALECIARCGRQYEEEHRDDVIERLQFGVDGDEAVDYDADLPEPFASRPSLGARLFVRSNTGRFFLAVLDELSSWRADTRRRSVDLTTVLAVYCEEHLTKDFQQTARSVVRGIQVELSDSPSSTYLDGGESEILIGIRMFLKLMAKYVQPSAYLPVLIPRIAGNNPLQATSYSEDGSHSEQERAIHALVLTAMVEGTALERILPSWLDLLTLVASEDCIGSLAGTNLRSHSTRVVMALLDKVNGEGINALLSHCNQKPGERERLQTIVSTSLSALTIEDEVDSIEAHQREEASMRLSTLLQDSSG